MKTMLFNTSFFIMLIFPFIVNGQYVTIKGYVTNEKNGIRLENVNLFESGSIIGTLTNKNGYFYLMLPNGSITLSATLDGFQKFNKKFNVDHDTIVAIKLKPVEIKSVGKKENNLQVSKNKIDESKLNQPKF